MTVAFVSVGTLGSGAGTSTPGMPPGWQAGHFLIAGQATRGNTTAISTPAGWTKIVASATIAGQTGLFYRIAQAGDSAPTFTNDGAALEGWIAAFSGVKTASPIHTSNADQSSTCGAFDIPALTITQDNALVVSMVRRQVPSGWAGGTVVASAPAGFTRMAHKDTGSAFLNVLGFGYQIQSVADSFITDEAVWSLSPPPDSSSCACAAAVILAAAGGGRNLFHGLFGRGLIG